MVVNMHCLKKSQSGMTLIELVLAMAVSAILMAALNDVVKLGLDAQTVGRGNNELAYHGSFALEKISDKGRSLAPKNLTTSPAANTTGFWFSVSDTACSSTTSCVMYCLNASNQLIESVTSDTGCTGTNVIARNVSSFSASLPDSAGAIDKSIVKISLSLTGANNNTLNLNSNIRMGGGTL